MTLTSYEYFKAISKLKTDEEILAFVKANPTIRSYAVGEKIYDDEYFVFSFGTWYFDEYPEEVQELVEKCFPGRILTEEDYRNIYRSIAEWMEHDTDNLPSCTEYLENVLNDMHYKERYK